MMTQENTELTLSERMFVRNTVTATAPKTFSLEDIRDQLKKLEEKQVPTDFLRPTNQLHVGFDDRGAFAQWKTPNGMSPEQYRFTQLGLSHLNSEVLPSRFYTGLQRMAQADDTGRKLATLNYNFFLVQSSDKIRRVRSIQTNISDGKGGHTVTPIIRSVHSDQYAPYSNIEFVQDLLDQAPELAKLPVLSSHVSDNSMRIRFAGEAIELKKPIRMYEAWNSEVGNRSVSLKGGIFKLICTNGMGHWDNSLSYRWAHRGNTQRIRDGVSEAMKGIDFAASQAQQLYTKALTKAINDFDTWFKDTMAQYSVATETSKRVLENMNHVTTTPGYTLASVVDSLTLTAQARNSLDGQEELEQTAARILADFNW